MGIVRSVYVTSYLEVGAREGYRFFNTVIELPKSGYYAAVDLPGANWGRNGSEAKLHKAKDELESFGYQNVNVIIGDSASQTALFQARGWAPYDCVFIDADHSYDCVARDWDNYAPMAKKLIAFHDVSGTGCRSKHSVPVEVPKLWDQIRKQYPHVWIESNKRFGIGVIFK
jgi:predicted O-methyltransferase YrrM